MSFPLVVLAAPFIRRDHGIAAETSDVAVPWRPILLVGTELVLFYMVDTAAATWGPTYLDDTFANGYAAIDGNEARIAEIVGEAIEHALSRLFDQNV